MMWFFNKAVLSKGCPENFIRGLSNKLYRRISNKLYRRVVQQISSEACPTDLISEGCPMDFDIGGCPMSFKNKNLFFFFENSFHTWKMHV